MIDKSDEPHDPTDMSHPRYDSAKDPLSPFYSPNKSDAEWQPEPSDEDTDKVGPGHPPKQFRWKPRGPSPNPKGRPKKVPTLKPDLKKLLEDALNEKIVVSRDNKEIVLTKAALGIQQLVHQFAKGDRYARRDLMDYAAKLGVDLLAGQKAAIEEALGIDQQAILDDYVRRRQQLPSAEAASDDHVKAPPDLLDDDVTKSEPNENPATSLADTPKKSAKPVPDESGRPKPAANMSDIEYILAAHERYVAQQKKDQGGS
jgi:hypothetical protein